MPAMSRPHVQARLILARQLTLTTDQPLPESTAQSASLRVFDEFRGLLVSVAYRLLGSLAEDVELAESISLALIVVLETLSPLERAVFVLREVFGFSHAEIGEILGRTEVTVRQLATRARSHVRARRPRFETDRNIRISVTERFLSACSSGDLAGLLGVLAPGVTLINDGGGQLLSARKPVQGASAVSSFMLSISRGRTIARYLGLDEGQPLGPLRVVITDINGGPGVVLYANERPIAAFVLDIADGLVQVVRLISNPDKLSRLTLGGLPIR
jgi:RNA polymerase sigma-70 factor (ECF subfamily)